MKKNAEKCFYRVKAKINENIVYSNIVTIQLKQPSSNEESEGNVYNNNDG